MKSNFKRYLAEGIGSLILVTFGCGTSIFAYSSVSVLGIALSFGLTYLFCYFIFAQISGCHLNPIFSFAALMTNHLDIKNFLFYVLSQFIGAFIGALLLFILILFTGNSYNLLSDFHACCGYDLYSLSNITIVGAIIFELIASFIFVFVFMTCNFKISKFLKTGFVISITYIALILIGFNITGLCANPIRAFAPAIMVLMLGIPIPIIQFFVFLIVNFIGSFIAVLVFRLLYKDKYGDFLFSILNIIK